MLKKYAVPYVLLALVAGLLHYGWEISHIGLYTGYEKLEGLLPVTLYATAGDIMYTVLAVLAIALFKRNLAWWLAARGSDFALIALIGFVLALCVEYKALWLGLWAYLPAMPIIPLLGVGLSPVLQMTMLLPLSVVIARLAIHRTPKKMREEVWYTGITMDSGLESTPKANELSERERQLEGIRKEMQLLLGGMSAPITHGRDPETDKVFFEIKEGSDGHNTFDEFEAEYKQLGELLERLRALKEKAE